MSFKSKNPLPSEPVPKFSIENTTISSHLLSNSMSLGPNLETVLNVSKIYLKSSFTIFQMGSLWKFSIELIEFSYWRVLWWRGSDGSTPFYFKIAWISVFVDLKKSTANISNREVYIDHLL